MNWLRRVWYGLIDRDYCYEHLMAKKRIGMFGEMRCPECARRKSANMVAQFIEWERLRAVDRQKRVAKLKEAE